MSSVTANDPSKAKYEISGDTTEWDDILIKKGITTKEDVLLAKGLDPTKVDKSFHLVQMSYLLDLSSVYLK